MVPKQRSAANRLGLDYEAHGLGRPPTAIIDAHAHINGSTAVKVYQHVARLYGVKLTYSQTQLAQAPAIKEALGDAVRFIAIPSYMDPDPAFAHRQGMLDNIRAFHDEFGARIVKFWSSPRFRDYFPGNEGADLVALDSPWRIKAAELAQSLGMMFMVHVSDPDTWFATKYADRAMYGTKPEQYEPLERMLDRFGSPWIAAHMGGWPEDLDFLDRLLEKHENLYLDTSATKWMVRELSRHPSERLVAFLQRWRGRVLFGSDIVTSDDHFTQTDPEGARYASDLASDEAGAFDLYASRYWALRTMFETEYDGESPIADPDLAMVEPGRYDAMSAPRLRGLNLPADLLEVLYAGAAADLLGRWEGIRQ